MAAFRTSRRALRRKIEGRLRMSRILIVDDDQSLGEMIAAGLAGKAREVHYRARGGDALELFRATEFDVVIADLNLASDDISGLDLCARITENRPGVPVI